MTPTKRRPASLAAALQQTKPFASPQEEAYLSIIRTASDLSRVIDQCLKPFGITQPQYNVLRILRGAGPNGLGRNEIRSRLVNAMPDVTRLLDRMEKIGWVERERAEADRRQLAIRITPAGLQLLKRIDKPLNETHARQFQTTPAASLKRLVNLLNQIRAGL